jgi:hypothetical protein
LGDAVAFGRENDRPGSRCDQRFLLQKSQALVDADLA